MRAYKFIWKKSQAPYIFFEDVKISLIFVHERATAPEWKFR